MASKTTNPDDFHMSFGEHLEDLRSKLIRALAGVALMMIITLYYGRDLIAFACDPLFRILREEGLDARVITTSPAAPFTVYFKVALIGGAILAAPWVLYQIWQFVAVGLYSHERRVVHVLAPFSTVMTLLGLVFMYKIMLPICLAFLVTFAVGYGDAGGFGSSFVDELSQFSAEFAGRKKDDPILPDSDAEDQGNQVDRIPSWAADPEKPVDGQVWVNKTQGVMKIRIGQRILTVPTNVDSMLAPMIKLDEYISFVIFMTLGIVIGFQLPVVMLIGGWIQILDPRWLGKYRKYCVFACAIVGAVLTPADPISMVILALPLYILFEFGLLLAKIVYKTRPAIESDEGE